MLPELMLGLNYRLILIELPLMSNQIIPDHKFPVDVCGIFKITEILNDRWTILLLREAFYGVTKFNDF